VIVVATILAALTPGNAWCDPDYGTFFLPGLDPVLRATDDPRLLGVDRLDLRQRLLRLGIDPLKEPQARPTLYTTFRAHLLARMNLDFERQVEVLENNGRLGIFSRFRYPEYFFLFRNPETLPGGFLYYPPRRIEAEEVELFLDDPDLRLARSQGVAQIAERRDMLNIMGAQQRAERDRGLINLTIPVKLPRTLEKIIGRGEKTQIRISGREHISIAGESSVSNQFVPNERVSSQSLFPTLDMEQQLQINLNGTIGEKIKIDVEHNSQAIGSEGTKIRLTYEGTEDEIVKTIETGDVGLTLPGAQLLGYSSNKSGLFGVKVTGQVGRADFTVVASKQKSESAAKSFNSQGGEVGEHIIESSDYINNRFFRLDLPPFGGVFDTPDVPGRTYGVEFIDPNSILVYKFIGAVTPGENDIDNVAVAVDSTGTWDGNSLLHPDETIGDHDVWIPRERWRAIEFELWVDQQGNFVAIDLGREMDEDDLLAVVYNVVDADGELLYAVGDRPGADETRPLVLDDVAYLRMKLLKPSRNFRDPHTFQYVLRNIYRLGGTNIDAQSFDLRLEYKSQGEHPELESASQLPWIQVFGLDLTDAGGNPTPDGLVDKADPLLFDLRNGLLKFPLYMPRPFAAEADLYETYANDTGFDAESSVLFNAEGQPVMAPLYDWETTPNLYSQHSKFQFVVQSAAASSSFNLGVSNIEEGSESVILDGRTLTRDVDYEIDYMFGEVELKGDAAASLTADSQISVNYQYAPFFGGGQSNLLGLHVGYDLGQQSQLTTAWLYESNQIIGEKAKLGEEPSRTVVGNVALNHTFKPYFLTHVANFLSRRDSERESSLQLNSELAISLPNPNTKGNAYLEDFEGIDSSDLVSLARIGWSWASAPVDSNNLFTLAPEDRVETRWFLPKERVKRLYLNPELQDRERDETQQALHLFMKAGSDGWQPSNWGGIMRSLSRVGLDLSKSQFVEFWLNDDQQDILDRRGTLHIDFGYLSEDFFWPEDDEGNLEIGTWQFEDANRDGVFTHEEDVGLDGVTGNDVYGAEYGSAADPFASINGTEANNREDDEDINGNTVQDRDSGYFSIAIDLAEDAALVDVAQEYADQPDVIEKLNGSAWRKYRIRLGDVEEARPASGGTTPDIHAVTHIRVWYEDTEAGAPETVDLQLSELSFLGSRWEREGIRLAATEELLAEPDPDEGFFIGEINNKEDANYEPPPDLPIRVVNRIPELEQSLVLDFRNLRSDHMIRTSKLVSPRGDDYTLYDRLSWYWYNTDTSLNDVDLFFRVGADTLNYYEVSYRFSQSDTPLGWEHLSIDMAELANTKEALQDTVSSTINDAETGATYNVRVIGHPDLRRVKTYYFGVVNNTDANVSGVFYMNDVRLEGVKREMGLAERIALRLNMADVIKVDFDWSQRDAEFHGLNSKTGQGYRNEDWNLSTNLKIDDFIPLLGFTMPISLSRRQNVQEPKYETNSDIEILDGARVSALSTIEERESFSARLSHTPSRAAIPRYVVDPWSFSVSGSQSNKKSPLERSDQKSLQGSVNYDLRIPGNYRLGAYPLLSLVPLVKGLSIVPKKVSFGGTFNNTDNQSLVLDLAGNQTPRPRVTSERGTLSGAIEHELLSIVSAGYNISSDRDLEREKQVGGVNIGEEINFSQDFRLTFKVPKATELKGKFYYPLRLAVKGLNKIRPTLNFNGGFADNHDPNIRQAGDPPNIRSVSNNGNWEFRFKLPVGDVFKSVFPERKHTDTERQRLIEQQRRINQQDRRGRGGRPGAEGQTEDPQLENLTPEERLRREEERLLREAEQRLDEEQEREQERQRRAARLAERGIVQPEVPDASADSSGVVPPAAAAAAADSTTVSPPVQPAGPAGAAPDSTATTPESAEPPSLPAGTALADSTAVPKVADRTALADTTAAPTVAERTAPADTTAAPTGPEGAAPADTTAAPTGPEGAAPADTTAAPTVPAVTAVQDTTGQQPDTGEGTPGEGGWDEAGVPKKGRFRIPNPLSPVLTVLRGTSPIQFNLSDRKTSSFARLLAETPTAYEFGLNQNLDVPDSLYDVSNITSRKSLTLSTAFEMSRDLSLDLKFGQNLSSRDMAGRLTKSYQQDWPDARLSLSGLEKWRVFGGASGDDDEGWFRSSSLDMSYKYSKTVDNYTEISYNPRRTTTLSPRWNFSFHNKMTASLNTTITQDRSSNNGTISEKDNLRVSVQLNHEFRAQNLLVKLGLYRPGSIPTIKMNVDLSYSRETTKRITPGSDTPSSLTGQTRLSLDPRFSYQISRNLDGALRITFSRNKDLATDLTRTSFGLGLEATFVF